MRQSPHIGELAPVYRTRIPTAVPPLFPRLLWEGKSQAVHLTFDDGPDPEWTPFVLDQLGKSGQKGTFFCIGKNIVRYPGLFDRIRNEGHAWGNHTMEHESGWNTTQMAYLRSYLACESLTSSGLFRPPYGRITQRQSKAISTRAQIVMWNVLTRDFDRSRSGESCLSATLRNLKPGSIAVMHDSKKAGPRLKVLLPGVLRHLEAVNWKSEALDMKG